VSCVSAEHIPSHLNQLDGAVHTNDLEEEYALDPNNKVQIQDVICGNGGRYRWNMEHPENRRFMVVIAMNRTNYHSASTKSVKSSIIHHVVGVIRRSGGYFLRSSCNGTYYDIGDICARERVRSLLLEDNRISISSSSMKGKVRKGNEQIKPTKHKKNIRVSNGSVNQSIKHVKNIQFSKGKIASKSGSNDEFYTGSSCQQGTMMTKECTSLGLGRTVHSETTSFHPMSPYSK
jgi:hypothetical protein